MSKVKGGMLMLFVSGQTVGYATNHTMNVNADLADTSNKDEGGGDWGAQEVNLLNWDLSTENMYAYEASGHTYDDLFDIMVSKAPVDVVFTRRTDSAITANGWAEDKTIPWYSGKAVINQLQLNAQNGEYANFTASFTGVGELKKNNP